MLPKPPLNNPLLVVLVFVFPNNPPVLPVVLPVEKPLGLLPNKPPAVKMVVKIVKI